MIGKNTLHGSTKNCSGLYEQSGSHVKPPNLVEAFQADLWNLSSRGQRGCRSRQRQRGSDGRRSLGSMSAGELVTWHYSPTGLVSPSKKISKTFAETTKSSCEEHSSYSSEDLSNPQCGWICMEFRSHAGKLPSCRHGPAEERLKNMWKLVLAPPYPAFHPCHLAASCGQVVSPSIRQVAEFCVSGMPEYVTHLRPILARLSFVIMLII